MAYVGATAPRLGIFVVDASGPPRAMVGPVAHAYEMFGPLATQVLSAVRLPGELRRRSIESGEDRRQVVFSVAEIVFEIVPLGFQGVEGLVLDFPPRPSGGGDVLDVVGVDRQIGDEAVAIGDLAVEIAIVISSQLTLSTSLPSRIGRPSVQRQCK